MRVCLRLISVCWVFLLADGAIAQDFFADLNFTPGAGDLSMEYLRMLFGNIPGVLSGGTNLLIGELFRIFNVGVLAMTMAIVGYTVFTTVVGVSQEGSGAFQTKISPWVTFRIAAGSSLLLPSFNGYSGIQVLVMSAVVSGIGFANTLWNTTVDTIVAQGKGVITGNLVGTEDAVSLDDRSERAELLVDIFNNSYKVGSKAYKKFSEAGSPALEENNYQVAVYDEDARTITLQRNDINGVMQEVYYSVNTVDAIVGAAMYQAMADQMYLGFASQRQYNESLGQEDADVVLNGVLCGEQNVVASSTEQKEALTADPGCDPGRQMVDLAVAIVDQGIYKESSGSEPDWVSTAKQRGWITAAMFYSQLIDPSKKDSSVVFFSAPVASADVSISEPLSTSARNMLTYSGRVLDSQYVASGESAARQDANFQEVEKKLADILDKTIGKAKDGPASPIDSSSLGFATSMASGGNTEKTAYFAFHHMVVLVTQVLNKLTGCQRYKPAKYEKNNDSVEKDGSAGDGCIVTGGYLGMLEHDILNEVFNPIDEMQELGQEMITAATHYWQITFEKLYEYNVNLVWATWGTKLAINLPLTALEASFYGSMPIVSAGASAVRTMLVSVIDVIYEITKMAMTMYLPFGTTLATIFFGMGVVLGIYLPFMPYLLFTFGAIGWLIGVAESMVAAPLVAMGVTHPEGHDLLGKGEQSLMLVLGIFIRPATMLLGFIFAINLATVAVKLLNYGFMEVLMSFLDKMENKEALVLTVGVVGVMLVYTYVMMTVLDQAYSLIYHIPDRILRWIGGPADSPGAGAAAAAREVKSQTQQSGQQVGQGASSATSAPQMSSDSSAGTFSAKEAHDSSKESQSNQGAKS